MMPDGENEFVVPPNVRRAMYAWRGSTVGVAVQRAPKKTSTSFRVGEDRTFADLPPVLLGELLTDLDEVRR